MSTQTTEQIPVNPEVMRWARETAGYSIDELIEKLDRKGITAETIRQWESGQSSPTYAQLDRLAYDVYKRPLAVFFFSEPPLEDGPRESFRTLPEAEIEKLDPRFLFLVRKARAMQENLREIFDGVNPAVRNLLRDIAITAQDSVVEIANKVRGYLAVDMGQQYALGDDDKALKFWRKTLEEHGIFIFKEPFREDDFSGFCIYDSTYPVIYINNSQSKARQIFTMFHELGHLLFGTGGVDFRSDIPTETMSRESRRIETICNKFAGEFLVPTGVIEPQLRGAHIDENLLAELAGRFGVSKAVILRKCLDLNLITQRKFEDTMAFWQKARTEKPEQELSGGNYYYNQGVYISEAYLEAAFGKYYQGLLTKAELSGYLGVKEKSIDTYEAYMLEKEM